MNLSNLPLACLSNISNFLPDHDKLILTSLNKNLRDFSEHTYLDSPKFEHIISPFKSKHPIWDPSRPIPDSESIIIQNHRIPTTITYLHITELEIYICNNPNLDMFPNLQKLTISELETTITLPTSLKYLHLDIVCEDTTITNLNKLINLEYFHTKYVKERIYINLDNHPNLQHFITNRMVTLTCDNNYPNIKTFKYDNPNHDIIFTKEKFPNLEELLCYKIPKGSDIIKLNKLTYLQATTSEVLLDLSKLPLLKHLSSNQYLIPKCGLPNIVNMRFVRFQPEITNKLFPKLEVCKLPSYINRKVIIDHDKLKTLNIRYVTYASIRAPKLEHLDIVSEYPDNIEFVGMFENLKELRLKEGIYGEFNIDFRMFPNLEVLDASDSLLRVENVSLNLRELRFKENVSKLDLRKFNSLECISIGDA